MRETQRKKTAAFRLPGAAPSSSGPRGELAPGSRHPRSSSLSPPPSSVRPASALPARVLIAHSDPALLRLIRESLETFLHCEVRTTSSGLAAFDRSLEEPYRLLLLDLHLPDLAGELLYDLITRTYPKVHAGSLTAPPVMWLGLPADHPRQDELTREARTKALLLTPLNIQRLIDTAATLLPMRTASNA